MIWLSFIVPIWVDHHSFHFLIALFCIPSPLSKSSFHLLSISYILTHFRFNTFYTSFTCFIDSLNNYHFSCSVVDISLGYLESIAHEFFYTCRILYIRAWVFDYWVYLSLWVLVRFSCIFTPWVTLVMHLECWGFMWEFNEIICFLDHGRYVLGMRDGWPFTKVFESLSYPPFHHWWYDFPLLY